MKNILPKLIFVLLLGVSACSQDWDNHYTPESGEGQKDNNALTMWEHIKSEPAYSRFVQLATETGLDTILATDQQMTLWIPTNDVLPEWSGYSDADKKTLVLNHINYIALYSNKLTDSKLIKTMAGKNLILSGSQQGWTIDNCPVTALDKACGNGVIHEIGGTIIPRKNAFEQVEELGDEYSMYRDTLLNSCERIFRPDLSFPIGVDEVGNTIYDSVFVVTSPLLSGNGDFRDENQDFTLFLPNNERMTEVFNEIASYYPQMTTKDSAMAYRWIFRSLTHKGKIDNYEEKKSLTSVYGLDWRTDIQKINLDSKRICSNGYIYDIDYFRVPHYLFLSPVETYPTYQKELEKQAPELIPSYFKLENADLKNADNNPSWEKDKPYRYYFIINNNLKDDQIISLEWTSINKNRMGDVVAVPIVPGRYKVQGQFRTYGSGNLRMSVNGIPVTDAVGKPLPFFNSGSSIYDKKLGDIGYIVIPETTGVNPVRIKLEAGKPVSGSSFVKRVVVSHIRFEPDGSNY